MDLRREMELRKKWFFETQLRRLNYEAFRGVSAGTPSPFLSLISEDVHTWGFPGRPIGGRLDNLGPVYIDNQEPVWSPDERARHDAFAASLIGQMGNWLDFVNPARLVKGLADLKVDFEKSPFSSEIDLPASIGRFARTQPAFGKRNDSSVPDEGVGAAISRAELAAAKPWLIPELYNAKAKDTTTATNWVANLEKFIADYENELQLAVGGIAGPNLPFDLADTKAYRAFIEFMQGAEPTRSASDSVKVRLLDLYKKNPTDKDLTYRFEPALQTSGFPMGPVTAFPISDSVKYWTGVFHDPLQEAVVLKANSDMGMCQIVRMLYRYGTLPQSLGSDTDLTWRTRTGPNDTFVQFFAKKAEDAAVASDPALSRRLQTAQAKLQIILESSQAHPRSAAPTFSPLAGEIVKQGLKSYKFWLDEPLRAKGNGTLNKIKGDTGIGDADVEMEFWSENHYIMFASSEYLLGQLWQNEDFQAGKVFLKPDNKTGILFGAQRKERGRARVLKWLNNRLQFGWMEFHSSGYYREHLWALLNLVDFALDHEVQAKATMVVDLLFFDVVRYLHKGSMGAPGGRSQFKSKNCGWDNDLGDVVEMMLGTRGIFNEGSSAIGCSFATSSYVVPDVLLEMGASPPSTGFTDRSRVSITFDEAPRYGITYSLKSDAKDSVFNGYAPKRAKYFPFLDNVNREITRTHQNYGSTEDDTVFFWGMSAFYNKQVVRNTFATVKKFGLEKSPAFEGFVRTLIKTLLPLVRRVEHGLIGGALGALAGGVIGAVVGAVAGVFESDAVADDLEADAADDLSIFIEGSTRTRANILAYRTPDVMLASIQNFRTGQLNFQSSVNQATLNTSVNVFTTAGFAGFDISDVAPGLGGALLGSAVGVLGAVASPVVGAVVGIALNESKVKGTNPLGDDEDGPGWWTGYWALPMIVQNGSAAILAYDFHDTQSFLAETNSHLWFPKSGFDRTEEHRTSAYDDANFFLLDITTIGPKGFWLFGKVVHPAKAGSGEDPREGYVGVFSNQRPEWLDHEFDLYNRRLAAKSSDLIDAKLSDIDHKLGCLEDDATVGYVGRQVIEIVVKRSVAEHYQLNIDRSVWLDAVVASLDTSSAAILVKHRHDVRDLAGMYIDLANLQRIWKKPLTDYFANRDWYVDGKNVWIIQVGSKAEFGSFEAFMDRVSSARVHLDDSGDMECTYDIPKPDGTSDRLTLAYGNGGTFGLNGGPFATDMYPRFETPFVRGGRVEWGQREYCIEWNGKTLLHDFSDFEKPVRQEAPTPGPDDAETIKALVIYLRTGDTDMDTSTVATATVDIGCTLVTADQVVAAGPVGKDTQHDTDWIFFDLPALRNPDMSLTLDHPAASDDDSPEWTASFSIKALMGDRTLKDCSPSMTSVHFKNQRRSSGPLPLVVALSRWAPWEPVPDAKQPSFWTVAGHPSYDLGWQEYNDVFLLDAGRRLWHRRLTCGGTGGAWESVDNRGPAPDWSQSFTIAAVSGLSRRVDVFVVAAGHLVARSWSTVGPWSDPWVQIDLYTQQQSAVPLGAGSAVAVFPSSDLVGGGANLYVPGADGNVYAYSNWQPGAAGPWQTIEVSGFALAPGVPLRVADGNLLALSDDGVVWVKPDPVTFAFSGEWRAVSAPGFSVTRFAAGGAGGVLHVAVSGKAGDKWISDVPPSGAPVWSLVGGPAASPDTELSWVTPFPGRWWLVGCGADGVIRSVERSDGDASALTWSEIGTANTRAAMNPAGGVAAVCRAKGQIEVFAQTTNGGLSRTWWS